MATSSAIVTPLARAAGSDVDFGAVVSNVDVAKLSGEDA